MDWILDHLQIVIAIAGAIAYWLNARAKEKAGEAADHDGDGEPDSAPGGTRALREHEQSAEQEANNRKAQELIRRLRAEREGRPVAEPGAEGRTIPPFAPATPPPVPARDTRREQQIEARRAAFEREQAEALERQRQLAEQMAELKARKATAGREASQWREAAAAQAAPHGGARHPGDGPGLLAELRNARSLRKAVVLREVLGTPAGLR